MSKYKFTLTAEERAHLEEIVQTGKYAAYKIRHAQILLYSSEGDDKKTIEEISALLHCNKNTVCKIKEHFVISGMERALERKKSDQPPRPRLFDGAAEARLIAIACSSPPEGRSRWTLQMLSDKVVELEIVPHCTANSVHEVLKKNHLKPHLKKIWVISPLKVMQNLLLLWKMFWKFITVHMMLKIP